MTDARDFSEHDDDFDLEAELDELGMTMDEVDAAIAELEAGMSDDLRALWAVPEDLTDRVARKAWRRIQDRKSLGAFGDLFGLGWETTRAVIDPVEDPDV